MKNNEINFIDPKISQEDLNLFLGPFDDKDGPFIHIGENWTMAHIMHSASIFPSVNQAKKNGWDKPIPIGFTDFKAGKHKLRIIILTVFD